VCARRAQCATRPSLTACRCRAPKWRMSLSSLWPPRTSYLGRPRCMAHADVPLCVVVLMYGDHLSLSLSLCLRPWGSAGTGRQQSLMAACDANARCLGGGCVCNAGYVGDGTTCSRTRPRSSACACVPYQCVRMAHHTFHSAAAPTQRVPRRAPQISCAWAAPPAAPRVCPALSMSAPHASVRRRRDAQGSIL
jgi:hypothetical protein